MGEECSAGCGGRRECGCVGHGDGEEEEEEEEEEEAAVEGRRERWWRLDGEGVGHCHGGDRCLGGDGSRTLARRLLGTISWRLRPPFRLCRYRVCWPRWPRTQQTFGLVRHVEETRAFYGRRMDTDVVV